MVFISTVNFLFAQQKDVKKFELKWIENAEFSIIKNQKIKTSLIEGHFIDKNLNPQFTKSWEVANGASLMDFAIKNVIVETNSVATAKLFNEAKITSKIQANFNFVNAQDKTLAVLNLIPLIKDGATIKRIVSFEIAYTISSGKNSQAKTSVIKNSVLASGNWYKFAVDTTGVFKIDKTFLQDLGINTTAINPKNIQIFGNGGAMLPFKNSEFRHDGLQENAIFVSGEDDGSFDDEDYVLFYATGPHSWDTTSNIISEATHNFNIFSNKAFYFITVGNGNGKRIATETPVSAVPNSVVNTYHDYTFFEKDEVNILATGQQWFGDSFNIENVRKYIIPFYNIDTSENIIVNVRGVSQSALASQMEVRVNDQNITTLNFPPTSGLTQAIAVKNGGSIQASGNAVTIEINYNNNGNPSAKAFLDYIEILGKKNLIANGKQFSFRNFDVINQNSISEFSIANASAIKEVWNVTNPLQPSIVLNQSSNQNFTFNVVGGSQHEYRVLNENDYYTPEIIENSFVENQNLHSLTDIDYIIITQDFLIPQAQRLANYHIKNSNLKVQVVDLNKIYNEFSSGASDITAIRDFVKHLYSNSTTNKIKYVCNG